jgi:hypothetical protein
VRLLTGIPNIAVATISRLYEMIKLSKKLSTIRDHIIDHVHKNTPLPDEAAELVNWFETDGWDDLMMGQDYGHVILDLGSFSQDKFSDEEMPVLEEDETLVRNQVRVSYAREQIANAFEDDGFYRVPDAHFIEIQNKAGLSAVLVWLVDTVHGGAEVVYNGAFLDREQFYQHLRGLGNLLEDEQGSLTDETILGLWAKS